MRPTICASALLVATMGVGASGCHKTLGAKVVQPNPLCQPTETLRTSEPAVIVTGDHELRTPGVYRTRGDLAGSDRVPLHNVATFAVVSRDRLRFRVQLEHKWQEWADLSGWKAELTDDLGNHYIPESMVLSGNKHVVSMWDQERRSVVRDKFGDIVKVNNDGYREPLPLASLSMFRGTGSVSFYARDIFSAAVRSLTLKLSRADRTLEFRWQFADSAEGGEIYVSEDGFRRRRASPSCAIPPRVADSER